MAKKEKEMNRWYDDLIGCPSQCYYYFMCGNDMYCIYLRWRHMDPWTADIIKCEQGDTSLFPDTSIWKGVDVPFFEDCALSKLKDYIMTRLDIIMMLWPHCESRISLNLEEYPDLPSDVKDAVIEKMQKL